MQNNVGVSDYSDTLEVLFAEVPETPDAPTFVSRSHGDSSTGIDPFITIEWAEPSDGNGSEILGYVVQMKEGTGSYSVAYDGSTNPDLLQYKFQDGLTAGLLYTFKVVARNAVGDSSESAETAIYCAEMPPAMNVVTLDSITVAGSSSEIDVTWSAPSANGGSAVTGYYIAINSGYDTSV